MTEFFENCGYYTDGECNICGMGISGEDTFCKFCKDNSNCYYKQLKRLGQENAELKAKKEKYYKQTLDNEIQINELLQTLQEIKAIAEEDVHIVGDEKLYYDSIEKILQVITKTEEE